MCNVDWCAPVFFCGSNSLFRLGFFLARIFFPRTTLFFLAHMASFFYYVHFIGLVVKWKVHNLGIHLKKSYILFLKTIMSMKIKIDLPVKKILNSFCIF